MKIIMNRSYGAKCCVKECHNSYGRGFRMFRLPSKLKKLYHREQWLGKAGLKEEDLPKDARFCEVHFTLDQFEKLNYQGLMGLKSNAVPTRFGNNLSKTVSADPAPEPEPNSENIIAEPLTPLSPSSNQKRCNQDQSKQLTPASKLRKSNSLCQDSYSEVDMVKDALKDALKEVHECEKLQRVSIVSEKHIDLYYHKVVNGKPNFVFGMRVKR